MWGTLWARHRIRNPWCEIMLHKCTTAYVRGCVGRAVIAPPETGYTALRTRNSCNTQHGARDRGVHRPPKSTKPSHSQARHDCRRANKRANTTGTRRGRHARHRRPAQRRAQTIFRRDAIASRGRGEHLLWIHTLSPPPDFGLSALSTSCDVYVTAFRTACERPSDLGEQRFSQGHGRCLLRFQQQLHIMQRVHEAGETLRA